MPSSLPDELREGGVWHVDGPVGQIAAMAEWAESIGDPAENPSSWETARKIAGNLRAALSTLNIEELRGEARTWESQWNEAMDELSRVERACGYEDTPVGRQPHELVEELRRENERLQRERSSIEAVAWRVKSQRHELAVRVEQLEAQLHQHPDLSDVAKAIAEDGDFHRWEQLAHLDRRNGTRTAEDDIQAFLDRRKGGDGG